MNVAACAHENMVDDDPVAITGGWVGQGYRCADCGFQTMTVETYVPTTKDCPRCGSSFRGMADVPTELCDDCVYANFAAFARGLDTA